MDEIAELERQLQQKRAERGIEPSAPLERAEVHAAVGEKIQQTVPGYQTPPSAPMTTDTPSWQDPVLAASVQSLVDVAFTNGIQKAIDQAAASGNPALIDALHDVLADELHAQLLERKKIEPAP